MAEVRPPGTGNGGLELMIECRSSRTSRRGRHHPVTIRPDWTVSTPHDLAAEEVAAAFGGYCSCVDLVQRVVPAFRASLPILFRRETITLIADRRGGRRIDPADSVAGCCRGLRFVDIIAATSHVRSVAHLALKHRVPSWQLGSLLSAAESVWGSWEAPPTPGPGVERLLREAGGLGELWRAGVHPDSIETLASVASSVDEPFPSAYFLGLTYGSVDRGWLASVLAHRPDPDTATWLAWLDRPHLVGTAKDWGLWLGFELPRRDVLAAIAAQITPEYVYEIAALTRWRERAVAGQLADWARAGCRPTPTHFEALRQQGVRTPRPLSRAIDALCHDAEQILGMDVEPYRYTADRTDLAVMLEILGTRHDVVLALKHGVRRMADLDPYILGLEGAS